MKIAGKLKWFPHYKFKPPTPPKKPLYSGVHASMHTYTLHEHKEISRIIKGL